MSASNLARWSGIAAFGTGLIFLVLVLVNSQDPTITSSLRRQGAGYLMPVLLIAALLGEMGAIAGLHALQKERYGRLGVAGALLSFVAATSQVVVILGFGLVGVTSSAGSVTLALLFVLSLPALFGGMVLLGVATLRAQVLPRWFGVLFIVAWFIVATLILAGLIVVGVFAYGVFWTVVGYTLFREGKTRVGRAT